MEQGQAAAQPTPGGGTAKVRFGVYDQQIPTGNNVNVGQLRANYQTVWSVPNDAQAFVNGQQVDDQFVLQPGQQLEFHRRAGEKG
jgi:hypothetical protein